MTANDEYIVEALESAGLLNHKQGLDALASARKEEKDVLEVLVRNTGQSKFDLLKALAQQFGMETVTLGGVAVEKEIVDLVPAKVARRYHVMPLYRSDGTLTVALGDPFDVETLDSLRYVLKTNVEGVVALPEEIDVALDQYYPRVNEDMAAMMTQMGDGTVVGTVSSLGEEEVGGGDSDEPIIRLVNLVILEAFRRRASDIHLEPLEKKFRVRYRIDGVLQEVESPPRRLQSAIISRVKIMAGMSIAEKRQPQDGRIQINVMERDLDLRVSVLPANHGETVVMRILDKTSVQLGLSQLGFFSDDQQVFEQMLKLSDGILLVTGPTGSGKTTTLYGCLNELNKPDRKIITVEDPVEYVLSGVNQVQVRADIGMT
ncbi:MAG: ATPase, T2SS/T4P/T4SS family, partial [Kiritimatiellia bacterium]|nr:ATPase, T2SS/T4P/T4SS family [Kiritimatiellia bacterium]